MSSSCLADYLLCTGLNVTTITQPSSGGLSSEATNALVIAGATVLLGVWQYVMKLPRVQRFLGAENTAKASQLASIVANTETIMKSGTLPKTD